MHRTQGFSPQLGVHLNNTLLCQEKQIQLVHKVHHPLGRLISQCDHVHENISLGCQRLSRAMIHEAPGFLGQYCEHIFICTLKQLLDVIKIFYALIQEL